ncbi:MAG: metallo-mystery pair system four-Cys motif protein [Gallionella sp.]|nr:metallo-mystery pair system four-Cys motif protein [Gallionella sp.]MDD4958254.1 metallo-mystery pair system four-Cys motif protein [Gallionella sp.]
MKRGHNVRKFTELGFAMTAIAALVAGCGGGGGGVANIGNGTTVTGIVADGYLSGAKVCLDVNSNDICDTGEPFGTSAASGVYSISVSAGQTTNFPVVAEVLANSIDEDTASAVGQAFTLTAPAGASFVSPLTTLVQQGVRAGLTQASAVDAVNAQLGFATPAAAAASGISPLDNYVVKKGASTDQTNAHFRAHEAAKTVAAVLKGWMSSLGFDNATKKPDAATQRVLAQQAQSMLASQFANPAASMFIPASAVSAITSTQANAGALKAEIAAISVPTAAAATQAVTLNFDVINGATPVGTTGCATPLTLGNAPASGIAPAGTVGTIKDLRFYVSNVSLIDAAGNYFPIKMTENANQGRNVALLDFEDSTTTCAANASPATNTVVTGSVVPGNYVGVAFTVGVPQYATDGGSVVLLNHSDPAQVAVNATTGAPATPLPLQNAAMNWMWQFGRKFTKIEFTAAPVAPALVGVTTMVHLGSLGCNADPMAAQVVTPCASPNKMNVAFTSGFNPTVNKIALDLGSLFAGLNLTTAQTWMSGKVANMMTANPVYYYDKFQIDMVNGLPINNGAAQTIFKIK